MKKEEGEPAAKIGAMGEDVGQQPGEAKENGSKPPSEDLSGGEATTKQNNVIWETLRNFGQWVKNVSPLTKRQSNLQFQEFPEADDSDQ